MSQQQRPQIPADMKEFNRKLVEEFRANKGQLTGPMAGRQLLLLTTKGARTGEPKTVVIGYRMAGDDIVVIASNNGAEGDPQWYRNLRAEPQATVEMGDRKFDIRARTTEGKERAEMGKVVDYLERQQALTQREIPVVVLEKVT
jgi:deazaflavin-dependent oxidoreductase (nitroreductase family)